MPTPSTSPRATLELLEQAVEESGHASRRLGSPHAVLADAARGPGATDSLGPVRNPNHGPYWRRGDLGGERQSQG